MIRALAVALAIAGCATPGPYPCTESSQCTRDGVTGICQPHGFCSFLDLACDSGQRFDESAGDALEDTCVPTEPAVGCIAQIALGDAHSCIRTTTGTVECWGANASGQLGDGDPATTMPQQTKTPLIDDAVDLNGGGRDTCAVAAGGAKCWGANEAGGKLGDGSGTVQPSPVAVAPPIGLEVTQISASDSHTCAITPGGAHCWGFGLDGQLGTGEMSNSTVPTEVMSSAGYEQIHTGVQFTCARKAGTLECWGLNGRGQVGNAGASREVLPVPVMGLPEIRRFAVGNAHACAVAVDGRLFCWGKGEDGQLGLGNTSDAPVAREVTTLSNIIDVAAGSDFTCALDAFGVVTCWGINAQGELGDDSIAPHPNPAPVLGVTDATALGVGDQHACVRRRDGTLACWGNNRNSRALINGDPLVLDVLRPTAVGFVCR